MYELLLIIITHTQSTSLPGESSWSRFNRVFTQILREEGWRAFYKGLTPRLLRVAPGQAITFMVYERIQQWLQTFRIHRPPKFGTE